MSPVSGRSRERLRDLSAADRWDMFQTMTADTLKAKYMVDAMLRPSVTTPPQLSAHKAKEYVDAALRRAEQFESMLTAGELPTIFEVMRQDLTDAAACLHQFSAGSGEPSRP